MKVSIFHPSLPLSEVSPLTLIIASCASRVIGALQLLVSVVLLPGALGWWAFPPYAASPELHREQASQEHAGTSAMSRVVRFVGSTATGGMSREPELWVPPWLEGRGSQALLLLLPGYLWPWALL